MEEITNKVEIDKEFFNLLLRDSLYDEAWCTLNGIDYVNPDISKAKKVLKYEVYLKYTQE